ncbi:MAG: adenosylcobinamide-phosphate synthase CbiB [Halocynthiibacter sp.]
MSFTLAMAIAILIDAIIGWPNALFRQIGHPVTWIGAGITRLEAQFNTGDAAVRRKNGTLTAMITIGVTVIIAALIMCLLPDTGLGTVILGILAWPFVAIRSLHDHVAAVGDPIRKGDIAGARRAVSMIVGRNPKTLSQRGVIRAAIESLAENTSDGVIAPLFWGALFGLPGIAGYKAINTLDSMIGHKSDRYLHFGRFSALTDDVVNWVPARITGGLFAICGRARKTALDVMKSDAALHRSPNAGWPEAAMAACLGIRLSGPRIYDGIQTDDPWVNETGRGAIISDIDDALVLYRRSMMATFAALIALSLLG